MVPTGIVVHSTGVNNPYLKRYVDASDEVGINRYGNHWNTAMPGGKKVCVHAFIGYDDNN
jgi:N-acetylmuramoyl-L-alanine amidase